MSTKLGAAGGMHDIDVDKTAAELEKSPHCRFAHPVHRNFLHLWRAGDIVSVQTSDSKRYQGMVLDVSHLTSAVLIELNPAG